MQKKTGNILFSVKKICASNTKMKDPIFFDFKLCDSVTLSQALKVKAYHIYDTLKKDCPRLPRVQFVAVEKRDSESNTLAYATLGKKVIYIDTSITYSNCCIM